MNPEFNSEMLNLGTRGEPLTYDIGLLSIEFGIPVVNEAALSCSVLGVLKISSSVQMKWIATASGINAFVQNQQRVRICSIMKSIRDSMAKIHGSTEGELAVAPLRKSYPWPAGFSILRAPNVGPKACGSVLRNFGKWSRLNVSHLISYTDLWLGGLSRRQRFSFPLGVF